MAGRHLQEKKGQAAGRQESSTKSRGGGQGRVFRTIAGDQGDGFGVVVVVIVSEWERKGRESPRGCAGLQRGQIHLMSAETSVIAWGWKRHQKSRGAKTKIATSS